MAEIKSIDVNDKIEIKLTINRDEYKILKHHVTDLVVLPGGKESLTYTLTTGKLGNSNRIMLPKKVLSAFEVGGLDKRVPAKIFKIDGDSFLLIKIKRSELGIPKFKDKEESKDREEKK
jgi:hypothetical protein